MKAMRPGIPVVAPLADEDVGRGYYVRKDQVQRDLRRWEIKDRMEKGGEVREEQRRLGEWTIRTSRRIWQARMDVRQSEDDRHGEKQ